MVGESVYSNWNDKNYVIMIDVMKNCVTIRKILSLIKH
jgi:hypothetical protein